MKPLLHLPLLAALSLAGCGGSAPPVPPDSYYRLNVAAPERKIDKAVLDGVLSVATLEGDGLVRGRPLLFTRSGDGAAVRQYNYHLWADSPTRLVQGQLAQFLKDSDIAGSVVTPELRVRADYELTGRILRLERVLGAEPPKVAAELELAVVRQSDRKLILVRSYRADIPCTDDSVGASVTAMNAALARIFARFTADLRREAGGRAAG